MRRVLKYPVINPEGTRHAIPVDAPLRLVATQNAVPTLWFEVEEGSEPVQRTFVFCGTGHEIPWAEHAATHLGSSYDLATGLVWHVYELVGQ